MPFSTVPRAHRCELLALADRTDLLDLADDLLGGRLRADHGDPDVHEPAEVGLVMMHVREPVAGTRFQLGEVVVSRAEVEWHGHVGWAMRLGTDRAAALSAALCDAAAEIDPVACRQVEELCLAVGARRRDEELREWSQLLTTRVAFEELD